MPTRASAPDITTQRTSKSNARLWPYKLLFEPTPDWESNAKDLAGPLRSAHHLAGLMQHKRESFRNPGNPQSEVGFHASQEISYIPQKALAKTSLPRLRPIGTIRSILKKRKHAPMQGSEGAPDAWLELAPFAVEGFDGLAVGDEIIVMTWLHEARRDVLKVHPRSDRSRPLAGVFTTRSPDRPNPLGLHRVVIRKIENSRLRIGPIEVIDGTPVADIKPILCDVRDS